MNELIGMIPAVAGETLRWACLGCHKEMICGKLYPRIRDLIGREDHVKRDNVWLLIYLKLFGKSKELIVISTFAFSFLVSN